MGERVTGTNGDFVPRFPSAAMAACPSSLSSTGTALPASILEAKGMMRERGGQEGSILGLPDGVTTEKGGDHGRPWLAAGELAGSSARAGKERVAACHL